MRNFYGVHIVGFVMGAAVLGSGIDYARACSIDDAVNVLYRSNDTVQKAIAVDMCADDKGALDAYTHDARSRLSAADMGAYDTIEGELNNAYAMSGGTDSDNEQVSIGFCDAVANR